jgi:SAM-dependent methyltransferase
MTQAKPWHEDDSFWQTWGPVMFRENRVIAATQEVDQILSLVTISRGAHILDLCCGVGRHSLALARRGFRVTGVDRTSAYLKQASEKAAEERLDIEFIQDDMRTFCRPDSFDVTLNLFTSFGFFEDQSEDRKVVLNVFRSLRNDGVFILDMSGKEILARTFQERAWNEADGVIWLQERKLSQDWSWIENRWILLKENRRYEDRLGHRLYSAAELKTILESGGFKDINIYGDFDGSPYDHTARRLVAVAYKRKG